MICSVILPTMTEQLFSIREPTLEAGQMQHAWSPVIWF
jgi:hypothetical protein